MILLDSLHWKFTNEPMDLHDYFRRWGFGWVAIKSALIAIGWAIWCRLLQVQTALGIIHVNESLVLLSSISHRLCLPAVASSESSFNWHNIPLDQGPGLMTVSMWLCCHQTSKYIGETGSAAKRGRGKRERERERERETMKLTEIDHESVLLKGIYSAVN